ncbi:MAG: 7-carboxy-7-deazaguanine synthase QueE [Candidatus Omnitrophota bacterium]
MNGTAMITEIFASIQGEGFYAGHRHIFIRFKGCNLKCSFCDTRSRIMAERISVSEVLKRASGLMLTNSKNTVALTGGEPLLQDVFLKELLPRLASKGVVIYLETNGTLTQALECIISYIDIIAMDIKLPSVCGISPCWRAHKIFLNRARDKEFFIKVVVSDAIDMQEFDKALALVKETGCDVPIIIQPETRHGSLGINVSADTLFRLQERALGCFSKVLVMPQSHKMMGLK